MLFNVLKHKLLLKYVYKKKVLITAYEIFCILYYSENSYYRRNYLNQLYYNRNVSYTCRLKF